VEKRLALRFADDIALCTKKEEENYMERQSYK